MIILITLKSLVLVVLNLKDKDHINLTCHNQNNSKMIKFLSLLIITLIKGHNSKHSLKAPLIKILHTLMLDILNNMEMKDLNIQKQDQKMEQLKMEENYLEIDSNTTLKLTNIKMIGLTNIQWMKQRVMGRKILGINKV